MKRVIIFGAGQAGKMARNMLDGGYRVLAYCDNNAARWGTEFDGLPVVSPAELQEQEPDLIQIAMLNREAAAQVWKQLVEMGFPETALDDMLKFRDKWDLRLAVFRLLASEIKDRGVTGDVAELGVFQGEFAAEINREFPDRRLHLFDTFEGFPEEDLKKEPGLKQTGGHVRDFSQTSVEAVGKALPHPEQAEFHVGRFPDTIPEGELRFAFVSLDPDLYQPTIEGLRYFYPRLTAGGAIIIHDYNSAQFPGAGQAVKEFCREQGLFVTPLPDMHGSALLMKTVK